MEKTLDTGVQMVLNALDMGKYIPVFEKYGVSMKVFTSLTKDDLESMDVEASDFEPILKYARKLGRNDPKISNLDLQIEDVRRGMNIVQEHLKCIDVSLCYTAQNFNPEDWIDQLADEKTLSEIAIESGDHIQNSCKEFNDVIEELLDKKTVVKPEKKFSRTLMLPVIVAAIATAVYALRSFK